MPIPEIDLSRLDTRVDALIAAQAERTPDRVAAVSGGEILTYKALMSRADAHAQSLADAGVGAGDLVGVHVTRSLDMLAAVIGVMRLGAAYVPLDPEFPPARLEYMIADSGMGVVLTDSDAPPPGGYRVVDTRKASASASVRETPPPTGDALAYVLYTSGSTGAPKGVQVEHRSVVNFLLSMAEVPGLRADDRLVAVTTISFDIAGLELFLPLIVGAQVVIAGRDDAFDGERLRALVERSGATAMQATPSTWRLLFEAGWEGGAHFKALCGGEALPADLAVQLAQRCGEAWNMYGPTETTIWSTCYRLPASGAPVLIGAPIANTSVYVIDKTGRRAPAGVPGEILIGGAGVARGYLGKPELTAERFLPDPFSKAPGARLYRTGDFGRQLTSGDFEYRERADAQVKVRGFRVELGEIEAAIASAPAVSRAVCKVVEMRPGDTRLAAYVAMQAGETLDTARLREALTARLPAYMIPQHFVAIDKVPMTPNGKVDRLALPAPTVEEGDTAQFVDPQTATEEIVAAAFAEAFGLERVSADADFFDMGGHSLLAMRVLARLRREIDPGINLRLLFERSRVRDLARAIDTARPVEDTAAEREEFVF